MRIDTRVCAPSGSSSSVVIDSRMNRSNGDAASSCSQTSRRPGSASTWEKSARSERPRGEVKTFVQAPGCTSSTRSTPGHQRGKCSGFDTISHTRSGSASTTRLRTTVGTLFRLEGHEAADVVAGQSLAPWKEAQLDDERTARHHAAVLLHEVHAGPRGAAGGKQ